MPNQPETVVPRHVLVVDDNVELAQAFADLLELDGYRVTVINDGAKGLEFVLKSDVDVILCDLSMPQLEGDMFYYAAQRVRPELSGRFIFVTGHAGNPKYESFLRHVNARVLHKPVPVSALLGALTELFSRTA